MDVVEVLEVYVRRGQWRVEGRGFKVDSFGQRLDFVKCDLS